MLRFLFENEAFHQILIITLGLILSVGIVIAIAFLMRSIFIERCFLKRKQRLLTTESRLPSLENDIPPIELIDLSNKIVELSKNNQRVQDLISSVDKHLREVPGAVLRSIQGDLNHMKGTVAEHISYLQLNSAYDRLLPFNSIVDFIGIKFPRGKDPGTLDFIDIKTGNARLSPEQSKLRKLIDHKHINFVVVKITTDLPAAGEEKIED